ncbi:MAG: hypothetical protein PVI59_05930 [Anaerolineae bacterium]|jgi:hypothetical protein
MSESMWAADRIQVDVSGFFTTHHRFQTGAGELGELTLPAFSRQGEFTSVDGRTLAMVRTNWWRGEYKLREGGMVLAHARTRGVFRNAVEVRFGGWDYELRRLGVLKRGWRLVDQGGMALLEVYPKGVFKRGAVLEVLGRIDVDLLAFSYYLVHRRWQEETTAAAAAAS